MSEALKMVGVDCKLLVSNKGEGDCCIDLGMQQGGYVQGTLIRMQL
jgi:hypothetical protein